MTENLQFHPDTLSMNIIPMVASNLIRVLFDNPAAPNAAGTRIGEYAVVDVFIDVFPYTVMFYPGEQEHPGFTQQDYEVEAVEQAKIFLSTYVLTETGPHSAGYGRISPNVVKLNQHDNQIAEIYLTLQGMAERHGYQLSQSWIGIDIDRGSLKTSPRFRRLLDYCKKGTVTTVFLSSLDRIPPDCRAEILRLFPRHNVRLFTHLGQYDFSDPTEKPV